MANDPSPGAIGAQSETTEAAEEELGFVDRRVDLALCLVTLGLGIFLVYASWSIRRGSIPDPIGSGGWARVIGIALIAIAATLVFRRLVAWRGATSHLVPSDGGKDGEAGYPNSNLRPFLLVAVGLVWILLVRPLGFLLATFVLTAASVATMQVRSWKKLILVPILFTLITWLLFGQVFGIHFPAGPIEKTLQEIMPRFH